MQNVNFTLRSTGQPRKPLHWRLILAQHANILHSNLQYVLSYILLNAQHIVFLQRQIPKFHLLFLWSFVAYVLVIARRRVQFGKYFRSFSYFAIYFTSLLTAEILIQKNVGNGGYICHITRGCFAITSLSLAQNIFRLIQ